MTQWLGKQLGSYRLIQLLGQGGYADVYLAEHIHLRRLAAVKVLSGNIAAQDVQSFLAEAQAIEKLKHPHIVHVLDFGFEQNFPFLIMDYALNGTLRDLHPSGVSLPLPTVISYVKQVASALSYAHKQRLIHRDVKPENILIDAEGKLLLSDFGIVAVAHRTASLKTIDVNGTLQYMAPEQIQGKPRPASDQYALAIVVYEWLAGEQPFTGGGIAEIVKNHLQETPPSLHAKGVPVSPVVEQVILRALEKDYQKRFPDVDDFAYALEQAAQVPGWKSKILPSLLQSMFSSPSSQKQSLPPTQVVSVQEPPPFPSASLVSGISAEEELLITCIQALPSISSGIDAQYQLQVMQGIIRDYAEFFRRLPDGGKRIFTAFDKALSAHPEYRGGLALSRGKAYFLQSLGCYDEALITYIQTLPPISSGIDAQDQLLMIKEVIRDSAEFFKQLPDGGRRVIAAFDKALSAHPEYRGKLALSAGKVEFLKLFRDNRIR